MTNKTLKESNVGWWFPESVVRLLITYVYMPSNAIIVLMDGFIIIQVGYSQDINFNCVQRFASRLRD